jgi:hypothetical protein
LRLLRSFLIFLLFTSQPAIANTLTRADVDTAHVINQTLAQALVDIITAEKAMQGGTSAECVKEIRNALLTIQSNAQTLTYLITIGRHMRDELDEAKVKEVTKIATEAILTEFKTIREWVNHSSGVCSKYPLAVAKAQQTLQILDRVSSFVRSISGRL